jgi:lipopolysaccharide export system protein LptC
MMAVLAAGTWWLVRNAPTFEPPRAAAPPRHEPDYVMTGFVIQRFGADGTLRTQIEATRCATIPTTTPSRSTSRGSARSATTAR